MLNLDQIAAKAAQKIVAEASAPKELDILVTKALGVLQENGVYACVLFLASRTGNEKKMAEKISSALDHVLRDAEIRDQNQSSQQDLCTWTREFLANNLDQLLLVKQLWEQTLIYARYSAKAAMEQKNSGG